MNYGDIIEYIDNTLDENFNEARKWAEQHNTIFEELMDRRDLPKRYFQIGEEPIPTYEEVSEARKQYRKYNIDDLTARRSRKMAINDWAEADEAEYVANVNEVETYIAENLPYPV